MERLDGTLFARTNLRDVALPVLRAASCTANGPAFLEAHDAFERRLEEFRLQGLMVASLGGRGNMSLALARDGMLLGGGCGAHVGLTLARGAADTLESLATVPLWMANNLLQSMAPLAAGAVSTGLCCLSGAGQGSVRRLQERAWLAAERAHKQTLSLAEVGIMGGQWLRFGLRFSLAAVASSVGAVLGAGAGLMARTAMLVAIGLATPLQVVGDAVGRLGLGRLRHRSVPLLRWLPERIDAIHNLVAVQRCIQAMPHNLAHALERRRVEQAFWFGSLQLAATAAASIDGFFWRSEALRHDPPHERRQHFERLQAELFREVDHAFRQHKHDLRQTIVAYRRDCQHAFGLDPSRLLSHREARELRAQLRNEALIGPSAPEPDEQPLYALDADELWCNRQEWALFRDPSLATEAPDAQEARTLFAVRADAFEQLHDARRGLCKLMPLPRSTDVGRQAALRHERLDIARKIEGEVTNWLLSNSTQPPSQLRARLAESLARQPMAQAPFYRLTDDLFR